MNTNATTITVHASSKSFVQNGQHVYLPMITMRGERGRMIGSKCPEGSYREFRTFTNSDAARAEAQAIASRMVAKFPAVLRAAH